MAKYPKYEEPIRPDRGLPERIELIPKRYEGICKQFLVNLILSGYRITNPDGEEITEQLTVEVGMDVRNER